MMRQIIQILVVGSILLGVFSSVLAEQTLKSHEFGEGPTSNKIIPGGMAMNEIVAVRFEAESYPVQLYELQFYMGDGGDGDGSDCSSFFLKIWDDSAGTEEPGDLLVDTEAGEGLSFEISEAQGLQGIAFGDNGVPGFTATSPFRIGLVAAEKYCITKSSFEFNERPAVYVDTGVTPGVNFLYGNVAGDTPGLHWHRWEELPGITDSSSGDFVMQVIASGGSSTEGGEPIPTEDCTKAVDCNDGNECTQDICAGGECFNEVKDGACNIGALCSSGDFCLNGECIAGDPINCDDGDACTDDGCSEETGFCESFEIEGCGDPVAGEEGEGDTVEPDVSLPPVEGSLSLDSVQPAYGHTNRETAISLFGTGFEEGMTIRVGPTFLVDVVRKSDTACTAIVPSGITPGIYTVYVKVKEDEFALEDGFEVRSAIQEDEGCKVMSSRVPILAWFSLSLVVFLGIARRRFTVSEKS
jgi:hypothetical protein